MKKLFAVLLAVVMLLSLSATAFATGKITVANAPPSTSYAAYQIFDASVVDDKVVYTLESDSLWVSKLIDATDGSSKFENLEFSKNAHGDYVVIAETGFSAPDFADFLVANMPAGLTPVISQVDPATAGLADGQKTQVILNLENGYYLVLPIDEIPTVEQTYTPTGIYTYTGSEEGTTTAPTGAKADLYDKNYIDAEGHIISEALYNTLSDTAKGGYQEYYTRKATIEHSVFAALAAADSAEAYNYYKPDALKYTRAGAPGTPISQKAYNALPSEEKALYKENAEVWYSPADLDKPVTKPDGMSDEQWAAAQNSLVKGHNYVLKEKITADEYMALVANSYTDLDKYSPADDTYTILVPQANATVTPKDGATPVLTTVLDDQNVQVQNKNDMPLDKTVEKDGVDVDKEGVNVGDELNYTIATKIPVINPKKDVSIFRVWDTMSEGLTLKDSKIKITIEANGIDNPEIVYELTYNPATGDLYEERATLTETKSVGGAAAVTSHDFTLVYDGTRELTGNEIRFEPESEKGYTFELSLAVASEPLKNYQTRGVKIEYVGVVNENAVAELLVNAASLVYEDNSGNTWIKDDETDNYISRIIVDKYDSTNPTQKLTGAEFRLYWQPTQEESDEIYNTARDNAYNKVLNDAYDDAYAAAYNAYLGGFTLTTAADTTETWKEVLNVAVASGITPVSTSTDAKLQAAFKAASDEVWTAAETAAVGSETDADAIAAIKAQVHADAGVKAAAKKAGLDAAKALIEKDAPTYAEGKGNAAKVDATTVNAAETARDAIQRKYIAGEKYYYQLSYLKTADDPTTPAVDETAYQAIGYARYTDDDGLVYERPLKVVGDNTNTLMPKGADGYEMYENLKVDWVADAAGATKVVTDANGFAQFGYLKDGTYQLEETKAPIDYTKLLSPKEIVVDGSDATDKSLNASQRVDALTNIAYVENTPGTSLPSTGGVGATMMTIGGIALILAAGAFLVLRRRKEQE